MNVFSIKLADVFPEAFFGKTYIDNTAICRMISIADNYNQGVYKFDSTITGSNLSSTYEQSANGYKLYVRSTGTSNKDRWICIDSSQDEIPNSTEVFLKTTSGAYVSIYDLVKMDTTKIFGEKAGKEYASLPARVAAVTYAISCVQMKRMEIHVADLARISEEMHITGRLINEINKVKNKITTWDLGVTETGQKYKATLPTSVMAFLLSRKIIDEEMLPDNLFTVLGGLTGMNEFTANGGSNYFGSDKFKAWTQFTALAGHYNLFFGNGGSTTVPISAAPELDVFNPMYWIRSDDPSARMICEGDGQEVEPHWVFDPRVRDKDGNILKTDGTKWSASDGFDRCAYFAGFSSVTINSSKNNDDYFKVTNPNGDTVYEHTTPSGRTADYSVRWFGAAIPTGSTDMEVGMASLLRNIMGPDAITTDGKGVPKFTGSFKTELANGTLLFSLNRATMSITTGTGTGISSYNGNRNSSLGSLGDFWPIPNSSGGDFTYAYNCERTNTFKFSGDQVSMLVDMMRIYSDAAGGESTKRSNDLQVALKMSQQDISMATNFYKSFGENLYSTVGNIR
jgi:hypothetical protein